MGGNPHDFWTFGEIPMTSETSIVDAKANGSWWYPHFPLVTREKICQPNSGSNNYPAW